MPVLKHAKKKLRQDKERTAHNRKIKETFRDLIKKAKVAQTAEAVSAAFSSIDKAAKKHLLHPNKAGHMKSALSKVLSGEKNAVVTPVKKTVAKKAGSAKKGQKTTKKAVKKSTAKKK